MKKMINVLLAVTLLAALVSTTGVNVFANEEEAVATDSNIEEIVEVEEATDVEEELPVDTIIVETVTEEVAGVSSVEEEQVDHTSRSAKQTQTVTVTFTLDDENDGRYVAIYGPLKTTFETTIGSKIEFHLTPDFEANDKIVSGWMINDVVVDNYYMYFMNNVVTENTTVKPVFSGYKEYNINLGVKEQNTGSITGKTHFTYSKETPFASVFTKEVYNAVQADPTYYHKGWELNGTLYRDYESLVSAASAITNQDISLRVAFVKYYFTFEFFIDDASKDYVKYEGNRDYVKFYAEEKEVNGYAIIGSIPELVIAEGYEIDTWVFGENIPEEFTQEQLEAYLNLDDFICNQYFTIKVKAKAPEVTPEPTPEVTPEPTPEVTPEPTPEVTPEPTPEVTPEPTPEVTPEPTPEVTPEPTPVVTPTPTPVVTPTPTPVVTPNVPEREIVVTPTPTPTATPVVEEEIIDDETPLAGDDSTLDIQDNETPKVAGNGAWALVNLVVSIIGMLATIILVFSKKKSEEDKIAYTRKSGYKVMGIVVTIASIIIFIITENMRLPMIMVDKYTLLMVVLMIANIATLVLGKKWHEVETKSNTQQ